MKIQTFELKVAFENYKCLDWLSEFYTMLLYVSDTDTNSFAHFKLATPNLEKDKYLKKRTLIETNKKISNMRFETIKI